VVEVAYGTAAGASRPDRIAKGQLDNPSVERWFDHLAFPAPTGSFRFGTSGVRFEF
jgi:hypothetical protein